MARCFWNRSWCINRSALDKRASFATSWNLGQPSSEQLCTEKEKFGLQKLWTKRIFESTLYAQFGIVDGKFRNSGLHWVSKHDVHTSHEKNYGKKAARKNSPMMSMSSISYLFIKWFIENTFVFCFNKSDPLWKNTISM